MTHILYKIIFSFPNITLVLALLTLLATTVVITFVLFRAIIRLEEMGADV